MSLIIAGVDEAGRGPLAGPVISAAVILDEPIEGVTDSKKLTAATRCELAILIKSKAKAFAFGRAEVQEIDAINIHHATLLSMKRAIEGLTFRPHQVLVDGLFKPPIDLPCEAVVKGDLLIFQISAASILAKVARDAEMIILDSLYPGYGFSKHKGYATEEHRKALVALGPTPIHRKKFAPVTACLR